MDRNGGKRMDVLRTIMDEIECVVSKVEKEEIDRVVNLFRKASRRKQIICPQKAPHIEKKELKR